MLKIEFEYIDGKKEIVTFSTTRTLNLITKTFQGSGTHLIIDDIIINKSLIKTFKEIK